MPIRTYRDLNVFQEAYRSALEISRLTRRYPGSEQAELARQLRRSARSIPADIVEGWAQRVSAAELRRYLQVAIGSCDETGFWLMMSRDEGYLSRDSFEALEERYKRIGAMLQSL